MDYATQIKFSHERVDIVAMIRYDLNPGMLVRYLDGEYTGAYHDIELLKAKLTPHVLVDDMNQRVEG